jgi:hypothetical protein
MALGLPSVVFPRPRCGGYILLAALVPSIYIIGRFAWNLKKFFYPRRLRSPTNTGSSVTPTPTVRLPKLSITSLFVFV